MRAYFNEKNILFAGQHRFRSSHSYETAIHQKVSGCLKNIDSRLINLLLLIDFKKAFDMIDQVLLLYKLGNNGSSNNALKLMGHYFFDRFQMTVVNGIILKTFESKIMRSTRLSYYL